MPNGRLDNPKQYPFWDELKRQLVSEGFIVEELEEMPLPDLENRIKASLTVIAVDSFIQHFCWSVGKQAIVLWGSGDPLIFGHAEHINIIKDRGNIRPDPFQFWHDEPCHEAIWVSPDVVVSAVKNLKS